MKFRVLMLLCAAIAVTTIVIYVSPVWNSSRLYSPHNNQSLQQAGRRSDWTRTAAYGVELWIAWTEERDSGIGKCRGIFAFMENKGFNEETLRKVFTRMSEEYPQYEYLSIKIYTDEERLVQAIDDFRTYREYTKEEHERLKKLEEEKQKSRNYFEAHYARMMWPNGKQEEIIDYTPDSTKKDMIRINLKP